MRVLNRRLIENNCLHKLMVSHNISYATINFTFLIIFKVIKTPDNRGFYIIFFTNISEVTSKTEHHHLALRIHLEERVVIVLIVDVC